MLKRKAEGPPCVESEPELTNPEVCPTVAVQTEEQEPTIVLPIVEEHPEGPSSGHLAPNQAEPGAGPISDDEPFWALLAILGYETW